ncbi:MAG: hypothetical protein HKN43_12165 [Rhodothermales bacterium]|nr:hypothetical protein [Rhodothermales bacterium]
MTLLDDTDNRLKVNIRMTYDLFVSGNPSQGIKTPDQTGNNGEARLGSPIPVLRRFPPMLQFLTINSTPVDKQLEGIAVQAFRNGSDLEEICSEIYNFAMSLGYKATIGMQEVYCSDMPSFPNQTLMTALLMIDLQPLQETGLGYTRAG